MDSQSFKTFSAKPSDVDQKWYVVDATNEVVGRLASRIAHVLRGKHKPTYTPHVDTGDFVVVVNADKVRFTGRKETDKTYRTYSGYPGGEREVTPEEVRKKHPERLISKAVKGMMPKGSLGRQMFKKLKVYGDGEHPHEAQQPEPLDNVA
ncbi:50S ribosomal protein L13 [Longibacter sp.]|jgi:large subunit ribosomal protein L13|uniref:50S ribosomal protein L13 n=1 Tax=Longibacter sp. TaxID=2045415 RepID=UPI003EBC9DF3